MRIKKKIFRRLKPFVEKIGPLAMAYRSMRDSWQVFGEAHENPLGFQFAGNKGMGTGLYERNETRIFLQLLKNVDVFVDIGANIGYYCCMALANGKQTIAFEPIQQNLNLLYKNIALNHWENSIEVYPIALSNRIGITEIFGGSTGASLLKGYSGNSESYKRFIPVSTLDCILGDRLPGRLLLILVDIEGAERSFLEGAAKFLNALPKPVWMVEVNIGQNQPAGIRVNPDLYNVFSIFWDNGYCSFTADNSLRQVTKEEILRIVETGEDTLGVYNFLFIEEMAAPGLLHRLVD